MERISAAENIIIEMHADRWRLITVGETGEERGLLEAMADQPLRYSSTFAASRRLPGTGSLPLNYVQQVVLGWSHQDETWHLGLLLARDIADARKSRWCELARWPDPETTIFRDLGQQAGQSLARVISRPFNFIPQRGQRQRVEAPPPPLPALPLAFGTWSLERLDDNRIAFNRSSRWFASRLLRIMWYVLLVAVYVVLSVATLNTDLALPNAGWMLPNPELLPYLGLAVAAGLGLLILYLLYELLTNPNQIVVDGRSRRIVAMRGRRPRWQVDRDDLDSVYVTQVVNKRGKKRVIYHGEINLHRQKGDFRRLLQQNQEDETTLPEVHNAEDEVIPLTARNADSDLQVAGVYISRTLDEMPVWYDQRVK